MSDEKKVMEEAGSAENFNKYDFAERIFKAAYAEVNEEVVAKAKDKLKGKLRELNAAEKVVSNIQREVEDIKMKIRMETV